MKCKITMGRRRVVLNPYQMRIGDEGNILEWMNQPYQGMRVKLIVRKHGLFPGRTYLFLHLVDDPDSDGWTLGDNKCNSYWNNSNFQILVDL